MHCDGTTAHAVHDVAELDKQTPLTVAASCEDGRHILRPEGLPFEVKRWRDDDVVWDDVGFRARLRRADRAST